jgi:hypothetical protein
MFGILLNQKNGDAGCIDLGDHPEELFHHDRGKPQGGFVQHEQFRPGHQAAADGHHLLLAAGERAGHLVVPLLEQREDLKNPFQAPAPFGRPGQAAAHQEILHHRHLREELAPFRNVDDAALDDLLGRENSRCRPW